MNIFRKVMYVITAIIFWCALAVDDDLFPLFFVLLVVSFILFFAKSDVYQKQWGDRVGTEDARFDRLVDLLVKKGVVSRSEIEEYSIAAGATATAKKQETYDPLGRRVNPYPLVGENNEPRTSSANVPNDAPEAVIVEEYTMPQTVVSENIPKEENKKETTEFKISANLLVWVGVIAVLLGVGFFLKYAIENNIPGFGPTGRVVIGIFSGFIFLGIGEFLHAKYEKYSNMLAGTGIGLLYLSFFGMFYYEIGNDIMTLFFMGLVTATSLMLSVRYESRGIAILGLVGGYGTPLFFGRIAEGLGGFVLLNYLVILNVGVLTLAYFKNWSWAVWSGFIGTSVLMSGWLASSLYDTSKINIAITYLSIFWLFFTLATLVFYYFHDRKPSQSDAILMILVGLQYAGTVYSLLYQVYGQKEAFFGLIPLVLAFVYTGIAYIGVSLRVQERSLALYPLGMAVLFLTLVFPFEFDGKWLTVAWFSEAAVLGFVALSLRSFALARFAMPVYALGIIFLFFGMPSLAGATPILNERFFLYSVAIASAFCLMYVFTKLKGYIAEGVEIVRETKEEASYSNGMFLCANVLISIMVLSEMLIFGSFISNQLHPFYPIINARFLLLLFVLMYVYSVMFFSLNKNESHGQFDGRVKTAFVIANILVFIACVSELSDYHPKVYHAILNTRTLIFALGMAYAGVVSFFLYKGIPKLFSPVHGVAKGMFAAFNIVFAVWGMIEIGDYYQHLDPKNYVAIFNIRTLVLSIGIAYAGCMSYFFKKYSKNNSDLLEWPSIFFVGTNVLIALWVLFEYSNFYQHIGIYTAIFNVRFLVLLLAIIYTATVSFVFYNKKSGGSGSSVGAGYFITTNVFLLFLGLIEILDYHNKVLVTSGMSQDAIRLINQQASMYVTGYLVVYGFTALVVGLMQRFVLLRNIAITVLGIAIIKVFLNDVWNLGTIYRIVAFLLLGIALLVVGYLYNKYKDRLGSVTSTNDHGHAQ